MAYVNVNLAAAVPPYLHLASGLGGQAFSVCAWVKDLSSANVNHASVYSMVGAAGSDTSAPGVEGQFGGFFGLGDTDNGPEVNVTIAGASFAGWIFVAWTIDASGDSVYYAGLELGTPSVQTTATLSGTVTDQYVGHPSGDADADGKYASVKVWNGVALSAAEVAAEQLSLVPVRTSGIHTYLSCAAGTTLGQDQSGNGNDWTNVAGGTGTWTVDADLPNFPPPPPPSLIPGGRAAANVRIGFPGALYG